MKENCCLAKFPGTKIITGIGKISIRWDVAGSIKDRILNHYRDFLTPGNKNADIEIKIENNSFRLPQGIPPLLSTRNWDYLRTRDRRYFHFPRGQSSSLAEISNNFKNIRFSSKDKHGQLLLYLFPEILYSLILPEFEGVLLHACGIKIRNKVFIFMAPPEGGKSTMAKLALEKDLTVLNDDRIILRKLKDRYFAFGNPWHGEVGNTSPDSGEIKELFFLKKAKRNYIRKITRKDMFLNIVRNSFYLREDKENLKKVVEIASDLVDNIEGYILGFRPDVSVWRYLDERFI